MWILGIQIALIILGIYGLAAGKITLGKDRVLQGLPARLLAIVCFVPLPLSFTVGFAIGAVVGAQGGMVDLNAWRLRLGLIEAGITIGCVILLYAVGWRLAGPVDVRDRGRSERRRRFEDYPEDEDALRPRTEESDLAPVMVVAPVAQDVHLFPCSACKEMMRVPPGAAGKKVRCPKCGSIQVAPPSPVTEAIMERPVQQGVRASLPPPPVPLHSANDDNEQFRVRSRPDGRSRPEPARSSNLALILALAGGGVFVLLLGVVVLVVVLANREPDPQDGNQGGFVQQNNDGQKLDKKLVDKRDGIKLPPDDKEKKPFVPPEKKAVPPADLPPLPEPVPIQPTSLKEATTIKLPGVVESVAVGGAGRFLVLHTPTRKKLEVFDANEARLIHSIDVRDAPVQFTAGMTSLLIHAPQTRTLQRWNLLTGKMEKQVPFNSESKVHSFCMGSASNGPLLISSRGVQFWDIQDLKPMVIPEQDDRVDKQERPFWPGANGRIFGMGPTDLGTLTLEGGRIKRNNGFYRTWALIPGPDGKYVYPIGRGVLTSDFRAVDNAAYSLPQGGSEHAKDTYLPAHHGPYYFHVKVKFFFPEEAGIDIHVHGQPKPVATLKNLPLYDYDQMQKMMTIDHLNTMVIGIENMTHLIPRANLLVLLTPERDALSLHPVKLE